ncbi:hypothetical protein PP358_gp51 [Arthrobacter phage Shoya]|uniref:Uncharacterized protein n=1 Tax=Arthrobacter phage Shoya TaxID=2704035 RepID=A0A6G6XHZ0_9CAUD|nr:hypothetical protein PP358_gp51 [Arthrobacter phage Shoya]QIG57722.1 hypothetical protein SEA_SHOYA_51 [Arthrobacter phage Shoya]
MCNLMEHSERSYREHEAQKQEPIYAALAKERGITYESQPVDTSQSTNND